MLHRYTVCVMTSNKRTPSGGTHEFGGDWTTRKLDVLANYLKSYTKALKGKPSAQHPFRKAFIDAFAGTGYRSAPAGDAASTKQEILFPDIAAPGPQLLLDGSARRALTIDPPFDRYIFIERNAERCAQLEKLRAEFPARSIDIQRGDANQEIQRLCEKDWSSHRAVLFLDPYGMQVEWRTIEAIARTRAIDLWLLFPLGIGVNRLLTRSGQMPPSWRNRLNALLGTESWYDQFYKVESSPTLFDSDEEKVAKASMATIGQYFVRRLGELFPGVAKDPGVLRNSHNNPLYLFCFAVGNERGKTIALRIAEHLLKDLR